MVMKDRLVFCMKCLVKMWFLVLVIMFCSGWVLVGLLLKLILLKMLRIFIFGLLIFIVCILVGVVYCRWVLMRLLMVFCMMVLFMLCWWYSVFMFLVRFWLGLRWVIISLLSWFCFMWMWLLRELLLWVGSVIIILWVLDVIDWSVFFYCCWWWRCCGRIGIGVGWVDCCLFLLCWVVDGCYVVCYCYWWNLSGNVVRFFYWCFGWWWWCWLWSWWCFLIYVVVYSYKVGWCCWFVWCGGNVVVV